MPLLRATYTIENFFLWRAVVWEKHLEKKRKEQAGVELCQDQEVEYVQSSREENANILAPWPWIETSWGWAVSRSGSGVCAIVKWRKYQYFGPWMIERTPPPMHQKMEWPYLGSWATNKKKIGHFLSVNC